jgi:hypothetical protein
VLVLNHRTAVFASSRHGVQQFSLWARNRRRADGAGRMGEGSRGR